MPEQSSAISPLLARIPSSFTLGVATSSWQIEGDSGGRGRSIWDDFADVPGNIKDGTKADPACDHVNRLESDLDLIKSLGFDAYRFSVSWPRVMPGGYQFSRSGLDFYDRLIDGLLARNIKPALTLYHWDLPSELQAKGGWCWGGIYQAFEGYAEVLASRFGDRVDSWATLNEPWVSAFLGYATKIHAPGLGDPAKGLEAAYRLMVAHAKGMNVLRSHKVSKPGVVLNLMEIIADHESISAQREHVDALQNTMWLSMLAGKGIPKLVIDNTASVTDWGFVDSADLALVGNKIDWMGINYYTPMRLAPDDAGKSAFAVGQDSSLYPGMPAGAKFAAREPKTEMGWEIHAPSFTNTILQAASWLPNTPLYVTENGGAFPDRLVNGEVQDLDRLDYYQKHLAAALDAKDKGADLRGYFAWSLMDNIEWAEGLEKRFGIVYVDHKTQQRTPKASALWFKELNSLRAR